MLTVAFGESTMSRTQVQLWYKRFKELRKDVLPELIFVTKASQQLIVVVKKTILYNRRNSIREVADDYSA